MLAKNTPPWLQNAIGIAMLLAILAAVVKAL